MLKEPRVVSMFKKAIFGMVVMLALFFVWAVSTDAPMNRGWMETAMASVLLSVPVLGLLLLYEVVRSVGGTLRRKRDMAASDQAFLNRVSRRPLSDPRRDGSEGHKRP